MLTSRYVDFSFNPNYFKYFLSKASKTDNPTYDQALVDALNMPEVLEKIKFTKSKLHVDMHKEKNHTNNDLYQAVSKVFNQHGHPVTSDAVASLCAVALSRYYFYQQWVTLLGYPIVPEKDSGLAVEFNAKQNNTLEINLTQKELKLGDFTEWHLSSGTVFKARQTINLDSSSKKIITAGNISLSISKVLWDSKLQIAANEYLNKLGEKQFTADDVYALTPFLINKNFSNAYSKKYENQSYENQSLAKQAISNCFSPAIADPILSMLMPLSVEPPRPAPLPTTTRVIQPRSSGVSDEKLAPEPLPHLSPEEDFNQALDSLLNYVKIEKYEVSQAHYLQNLADSISNLTLKERKNNYSLLAEVMRRTEVAIRNPTETDNITASLALIQPLKKKNMHRVALAFTAIILGAIIVAASVAVALASFGVTSVPSIFGISIGTGLLTKGIAIATGVIGLGISAVGLKLFSHRPYKPIIDNVENIDRVAQQYNSMQVLAAR